MNAFEHGLTGHHEMEACKRLTASMLSDLKPKTEPERQLAQKIIDGHFRLNRLAGRGNNMFNFALIQHTMDTPHDDRVEAMVAQTRAWIEQSHAFELVKYIEEFKRVQKDRIAANAPNASKEKPNPAANAMKTSEIASIWLRLAEPPPKWS
jgi:hypothetical protein